MSNLLHRAHRVARHAHPATLDKASHAAPRWIEIPPTPRARAEDACISAQGTTPIMFAAHYSERPTGPHNTEVLCPTCKTIVALGWLKEDALAVLGPAIICSICFDMTRTQDLLHRSMKTTTTPDPRRTPLPYYASATTTPVRVGRRLRDSG